MYGLAVHREWLQGTVNKANKLLKIKKDYKAMVSDLEAQIDYLVGYQPSGLHFKQEWRLRETLIDETLGSDLVPQEVKDKIVKIQQALHDLREGIRNSQEYLFHGEPYEIKHQIKVINGDSVSYI